MHHVHQSERKKTSAGMPVTGISLSINTHPEILRNVFSSLLPSEELCRAHHQLNDTGNERPAFLRKVSSLQQLESIHGQNNTSLGIEGSVVGGS